MSATEGGPRREDDPFDGLVLDESFVQGAHKIEDTASGRAAAAQRARSAHADLLDRQAREMAAKQAGARRQASRASRRRVLGVAGSAMVVIACALWFRTHPITQGPGAGMFRDSLSMSAAGGRPTPQPAASAVPLGVAPLVTGEGDHEYLNRGPDGEPARYDPCRPIPVVVNPRRAPFDGDLLLDHALAEVTRRTGLHFVVEGETNEKPSEQRPSYQPDRYGDRWAPLLIAWSDQTESPRLGTEAIGFGGSTHIDVDGHAVYVTGMITLDGPSLAEDSWGGGAEIQAVIMHELGHVVGLDHVGNAGELMYWDNVGQVGFGTGDLVGLAELGRGPCIGQL